MFKLMKKTCPSRGVGFSGFRREDLTRMEGKFRGGGETPVGAMYFANT